MSSGNESEDSSDMDTAAPVNNCKSANEVITKTSNERSTVRNISALTLLTNHTSNEVVQYEPKALASSKSIESIFNSKYVTISSNGENEELLKNTITNQAKPTTTLANIPQEVLLQLIQSGRLQLHNEEDGSGLQYVAIPLSSSTAKLKSCDIKNTSLNLENVSKEKHYASTRMTKIPSGVVSGMMIKQELE